MNVIYSLEKIQPDSKKRDSIFLAGPTFRVIDGKLSGESWRKAAIAFLRESGFKGDVYIPEFRDDIKRQDWDYSKQVLWERTAMLIAKVIVFWIPRDKYTLPGLTTNIEFGEWFKTDKILVGIPAEAYKCDYIREVCKLHNIPVYNHLNILLSRAINKINFTTSANIYFTSDTHFGSDRTRILSKRPFNSVEDMDEAMIENWNKIVTNKDIVYHLGDFGDISVLYKLNFETFNLVLGNYDRNDKVIEMITQFKEDTKRQVNVFQQGIDIGITWNDLNYFLVHEPLHMTDSNKFYLFGHVHKLSMCKLNGLNVGTDCHNFTPLTLEEVEFYRNAILNHYDDDVFTPGNGVRCGQLKR